MAPSNSRRVAWIGVLICAAVQSRTSAQYVPIRVLDSNGLLQQGWPVRLSGDVVVGSGVPPGSSTSEPALWDASGTTLLPILSGFDSGAAAARDAAGLTVGSLTNWTRFAATAVEWVNGSPFDINTLVSSGASAYLFEANDMDRRGRILLSGESRGFRAYLLDGGNLTDLGALDPTWNSSQGVSMNDRGVVVGDSAVSGGPVGSVPHACLFANGQVTDLHDPTVMEEASYAYDVNRDGWVVGWSESNPGLGGVPHTHRGFLFDGTHAIDLSTGTPSMTFAYAINDFGVVVGYEWDSTTGFSTALVWQNGVTIDLNTLIDPTLGWHLDAAADVDNEGRICGTGTLNGVAGTAFILEPPCKGTFTSYGTGCPGTGGLEPLLTGTGCPAPDRDFALEVVDGLPGGIGFLFIGTGTATLPVKPGCDLQVLPLVGSILPFTLDSLGELWIREHMPSGTPIFDVNLQAIGFDPGAAYGISSTAPLAIHFE